MTVREILQMLYNDGWFEVSQNGSHKQFKHSTKQGKVTVPVHNGDLSKGTLNSILKQAQLKR
jgi:predicted RNA binding protein YcfA (HicA-like mRNA interferase family)